MALHIFKINEYDYQAERMQFEAVCQFLRKSYNDSDKECFLIGNYNIEGVELDGLLITSGGIRILEFKNWGGNIIARENGEWTSEKKIIEGGAGEKTPYEQIILDKSRTTKGLVKLLGITPQQISAAIIFWQDANIDTTSLSDSVKTWLRVFDNRNLSFILEGLDGQVMSEDFVRGVPEKLRIEEFSEESLRNQNSIINEIYEPEASTNFFDELESALKFRPDYQRTYEAMYQTFRKCLNQKTDQIRITFGGDFAKTDYLLKEYKAKSPLVKATNDTRVHLRNRKGLSSAELEVLCLYDLKNLCQFISFIYKAEIPQSLKAEFPKDIITTHRPKPLSDYIRVIVDNWDDEFVYVQSEDATDGESKKVCYQHGNVNYPYDWTYLKNLFYKDAQLNLIQPIEKDGVIYPELIIFEPDYLVNISTVAHCFTSYAESPYVDLIKKLDPENKPENFLMGNLAGQMLDEAIYQLPNTYSYKDTISKFFNANALCILAAEQNYYSKTTKPLNWSYTFHQEAQKQKQNIAKVIHETLPLNISDFKAKSGIVEPSFFSEMLGLQGRIDYLQMDFKLLIEQKSGKGAFPYDNFIKPKQTDEHYIQMLLYMAWIRYNFREIYELNNRELHEFLLYSKYTDSLLGLGFAPELIFNAIKVRNRLAWTEMLYTLPNGYRILDELKPEKLNFKNASDSLWDKWQRPWIASILDPIQQASELEKAYYFRFLTFISNEHAMSKLGNKTKDSSGFAATWHDPLDDKLKAGNIYNRLELVSPTNTYRGQVKSVTLGFTETNENDMANFRAGDIVILYPYDDEEPNACKTIVLRGTIKEIKTGTITIELRYAQSDKRFFIKYGENIKYKEKKNKKKLWAIEHDFMESSYSSQYKGMQSFLSAPKERRDLLLLQREPKTDKTVELKGDYKEFNELALRVKRAKDLFLIIGPPGTGKTSFGLLNTVKEELMEPDTNVLLLSFTNRAVDEICSKLSAEKIDYIRMGGEFNCAEEYKNHLFCKRVEQTDKEKVKTMLYSTRVYVGTTASLLSNILLFQFKQFSLAVIDEASQLLEPHLIGLFSEQKDGIPAIKKFVLIGDYKQLPSVVLQDENISKVHDVLLKDIYLNDCRLSLFERLLKKYAKNKDVTYMLHKQGRMHHDIALFPNYSFYNNQLEMVPLPHQKECLPLKGDGKNGITDLLQTRRISFIATEPPKDKVNSDKVNIVEANMIAAMVMKIYEIETTDKFEVDSTVGVIVPYRNQITTVRKAIDKYGIPVLHNITIDTVERYQGSQRKYIIYGFTIQHYYQLKFLTSNVFEDEIDGSIVDRKLNVAMTRAEEHLVMFGNAELLSNNFTFFKLMEFVRSKHGFFRVSENDFVSGHFQVPQYETDDLDLSKATFTVSNRYNKAFEHHILQPVKEASGEEWPSKVFGNDMVTNLTAIGYGRINFSNQLNMFDEMMSPERQVLIYCYYIMRQHYCSSRNIFTSYKDWLESQINSFNGRVQMIDIGCGPATCGIAFTEIFKDIAPHLVYTGIDVSSEMKRMGKLLWDEVHGKELQIQMIDSFNALGSSFWEGCSELPSLVIINMSYFFSNVNAQFTERLATQINEIMKKYPLNRYLFFIQHSECDKKLNSYKVFKRIISTNVNVIKDESSMFSYILNHKERTLDFCYTILTST
ncbi:MAG: AAA family ATPase [Bacteroidaceae bacterium]|nr:AAA family ATPase [Bacteroidaceae bacterium]